MSVSGIGSSGALPIKIDPDQSTVDTSKRADNKLVDRTVKQPDSTDQKIESRVAASRQQVSETTDDSETSEADTTPRKPKISSNITYAQLGIKNDESSQSDRSRKEEASDANRQTRADSAQPVDSKDVALQKTTVQF